MDRNFDYTLFNQVKEYAAYLQKQNTERDEQNDRMVDMYLMEWGDEDRVAQILKGVKITKSPDARNSVVGASRLLIATDPVFTVSRNVNDEESINMADKLEKAANLIWQRAGRVKQNPIHYDIVLSTLLFAESHVGITRTSDLLASAQGAPKAVLKRMEQLAEYTPYVFDVWDPRTGYPEFGHYGLHAFCRCVSTTRSAVIADFGEMAKAALGDQGGPYDSCTIWHFWDYDNRMVWVEGGELIIQEKHNLPFIPVVVQLGEGSGLFAKPEQQRQPFLYSLDKSGLWERQNLALTVLYTMLFAVGANPMFKERVNQPGKHLQVDYSIPGYRITLEPGEDFEPVIKATLDPSLLQGLEIANQKIPESTIYSQTLGQPLGGNAPYSMVALLSQAGRLPLVVPQKKASWGIAEVVRTALLWMKEDGKSHPSIDLLSSDIPSDLEVEAKLEVNLPVDKLQNAQIAKLLTEGEFPTVSNDWIRENILSIEQGSEQDKQIWRERARNMMFQMFMQDQVQRLQQQKQAANIPPIQPPAPQGGPMVEQPPQGMPPEGYPPEGMVEPTEGMAPPLYTAAPPMGA